LDATLARQVLIEQVAVVLRVSFEVLQLVVAHLAIGVGELGG